MVKNRKPEEGEVGGLAGPDDVAPEGTVITPEAMEEHRRQVEEFRRGAGLDK